MSSNPVVPVTQSSRVRCARCSRFVFRGDACRCTRPAVVYEPATDGVMPHVRITKTDEPLVEVTVHHHGPLDENGNWSSWGQSERPATHGDDL